MIPSLLLLCAILFPSNLFPSFSFYAPCTPKNPGKICSLFFGSGECIRDDTSQASLPISNLTFCKQAFLRSRRARCSGCICCLGKQALQQTSLSDWKQSWARRRRQEQTCNCQSHANTPEHGGERYAEKCCNSLCEGGMLQFLLSSLVNS